MEEYHQPRRTGQSSDLAPRSDPTLQSNGALTSSPSGTQQNQGPVRRRSQPAQSTSKAGFRGEIIRLFKAGYFFLQREQARKAWFIFLACVAVASLPWTARWGELRQAAIVLASLAAGAIFLPELNSGLWHLNAKEIRDTIPEHRRRSFYTELIQADCPEDEWAQRWAILMWRRGVIPLLDAARDNRRIRWNMNYEVSVHLHQEVQIGRTKRKMARVETSLDDERVLPAVTDGLLWVSFAGNDASLLSEFNENSCLIRELVGLPGLSKAAWAAEVRKLCHIRIRIGPRTVVFSPEDVIVVPGGDDVRIVRWLVPVTEDETNGEPLSCQIEMHFPAEIREQNFPALLAGYYCAGRTTVAFKLYHGQGPRPILRYFDEFLSEGGGNVDIWRPERFDTEDRQSVMYRTPPDSLLWPGSGIYFWWEYADG
jgi:hypothetical protein